MKLFDAADPTRPWLCGRGCVAIVSTSETRLSAHGSRVVGGTEAVAGVIGHGLMESSVDFYHDASVVTFGRMNLLILLMRFRAVEFHCFGEGGGGQKGGNK